MSQGYKAAGNAQLLVQLGLEHNIRVQTLDLVAANKHSFSETISTSQVRRYNLTVLKKATKTVLNRVRNVSLFQLVYLRSSEVSSSSYFKYHLFVAFLFMEMNNTQFVPDLHLLQELLLTQKLLPGLYNFGMFV